MADGADLFEIMQTYPMGRFGPVGRGPLADIVYEDRWGSSYPGV